MKKIKITEKQYKSLIKHGLIKESEDKTKKSSDPIEHETKELLKFLYKDISPFWAEHGLSYDDICKGLLEKGLIVKKGYQYKIPRGLGSNEEVLDKIESELRQLAKIPEKEIDEESSSDVDSEEGQLRSDYKTYLHNDDLVILKNIIDNKFYLLNLEKDNIFNSEHDVDEFLVKNNDKLSKMLVPIDLKMADNLGKMYDLDKGFSQGIEEIKNILSKSNDIQEVGTMGAGSFQVVAPMSKPITREIQTVFETLSTGTAGSYEYNTPGLVGIGKKGNFKKTKKTDAQLTTQYPEGGFVEFDSCVKLNNNKKAQNGGCGTGNDGVVKVKKTKGSIISPSLGENKIYEEVARLTGKTIKEVKEIIKSKK